MWPKLVVLTGLERGGQPLARLAPCRNILNQLFPNSVSTVFGNPLARAKKPAPGKGVDLFFFFDKFWL